MASTVPIPLQPQHSVRLQARVDTVYANDWTPEEQVALDATLDKFPAARHTALERYLRAAAALPKKGVRDVALRVKWLASNSSVTKRRLNEDNAAKKRPRVQSIFAVQPKGATQLGVPGLSTAGGLPGGGYPAALQASIPQLDDHGGSSVGMVGGPMGHLLEQNYLILNQYKQNMQQYKVHENTDLLVRFRDNIVTILNQMGSMSGLMQHMPPLPVRLNYELANSFLPSNGTVSNFGAANHTVLQGTGAYRIAQEMPMSIQQHAMKVQPVMPVNNTPQVKMPSKSQDAKASSGLSKPKSTLKKSASIKSEERSAKPRPENLRTSARRAALKSQPSRSTDVRSSARLAAASDSGQS